MITVIILAVLAWGVYKFFKINTGAGVEAVRAYYFLEALLDGKTSIDANRFAHMVMLSGNTEDIQRVHNEIREVHGGKQLPLIGEAYRRGMASMMPRWYHRFVFNAPSSHSIELIYVGPLTQKCRLLDKHNDVDEG